MLQRLQNRPGQLGELGHFEADHAALDLEESFLILDGAGFATDLHQVLYELVACNHVGWLVSGVGRQTSWRLPCLVASAPELMDLSLRGPPGEITGPLAEVQCACTDELSIEVVVLEVLYLGREAHDTPGVPHVEFRLGVFLRMVRASQPALQPLDALPAILAQGWTGHDVSGL